MSKLVHFSPRQIIDSLFAIEKRRKQPKNVHAQIDFPFWSGILN